MLGTAIRMGRFVGYRNIRDHSNRMTPCLAIIATKKSAVKRLVEYKPYRDCTSQEYRKIRLKYLIPNNNHRDFFFIIYCIQRNCHL